MRVALRACSRDGRVERDERGRYGSAPRPRRSVASCAAGAGSTAHACPGTAAGGRARRGAPRRGAARGDTRARCGCSASGASRRALHCVRRICAAACAERARASCARSASRRVRSCSSSRELDAATDARARALWTRDALARATARRAASSRRAARASPSSPEDDAMIESFLLGGRAIAQLVLDPLLPARSSTSASARAGRGDARLRPARPRLLGRASWRATTSRIDGTRRHARARRERARRRLRSGGSRMSTATPLKADWRTALTREEIAACSR